MLLKEYLSLCNMNGKELEVPKPMSNGYHLHSSWQAILPSLLPRRDNTVAELILLTWHSVSGLLKVCLPFKTWLRHHLVCELLLHMKFCIHVLSWFILPVLERNVYYSVRKWPEDTDLRLLTTVFSKHLAGGSLQLIVYFIPITSCFLISKCIPLLK